MPVSAPMGRWALMGSVFLRALTIATPSLDALLHNSITYHGYDVQVLWNITGRCDGGLRAIRVGPRTGVSDVGRGNAAGDSWRGLVVSERAAPWWRPTRRTGPEQPAEGPPSSGPSPLTIPTPHPPHPQQPPDSLLSITPSPTTSPSPYPLTSNPHFPNTIATDGLPLAGARRGGPDIEEVTQWLG